MIVAREFHTAPGAVRSWTYADFYNALQLLTEERLGKAVRAAQRREDAQWDSSHKALKR